MHPFYLTKNQCGFYKVRFVDPNTGKLQSAKSTHSKDKFEATRIAMKWLESGIPDCRSNSRQKECLEKGASGLDLQNIVSRLSDFEIDTLQTISQESRVLTTASGDESSLSLLR